jgi:ubiquinone/menaquinone biosynthesis C-methylase UbiE
MQNKRSEIAFFDRFASGQPYNVFTDASTDEIARKCIELGEFKPGYSIADLGCGSGAFTKLLLEHGLHCQGLDLSYRLLRLGLRENPTLTFLQGDVESLPFAANSLDGIVLSGLIHHLPDPSACAREAFRVLKPGASFVAFDPNRHNPFMWLYRDRSSPLYSSKGVTENERPVVASQVARIFSAAGFQVSSHFVSGLKYRYVASAFARLVLPVYNFVDSMLFRPGVLQRFRAFVFTRGSKC